MLQFRHIGLLLCITLIHFNVSGQSLKGLSENEVIKKFRAAGSFSKKSATETAENTLPFFEDFSTSDVYPDPLKWDDSLAFINNSFPVDPMSAGIATLDAIDSEGNIYALNDLPASSDRLTTKPFNLQPYANAEDTVILSFFYQSGGLGEVPEINDSLLLEFYSPADDQWYNVWYAVKDTFTDFEQVIFPISEMFCQDGFRFRFRNYTSMSVNDVTGGKGALSNVDFWNIDYIMMNTEPVSMHHSINDITLVDPPKYLLDFYEIIPWSHLNDAQSITRNTLHYAIRNLVKTGDSVNVGRSYYVRDLQSGFAEFAEQSYSKFGPNSIERRNDPFFTPFVNSGNEEEGFLEVGAYLVTPATQFKANDTARTYLNFKDYYAYDDGIPEYGFGISGESTYGAMLAYRFRIYRPDTLKAIDIFFNTTRDDFTSGEKFHLCIWSDENGKPGEMIYISPEALMPGQKGFLEPVRYPIHGPTDLIVEDSVFYTGWMQLTEEFLNVGYDVNRNSLNKIFVNITGEWFNPGTSILPGSLMIRPVFGSKAVVTSMVEHNDHNVDFIIYPNPVKNLLHILTEDPLINRIILYDGLGRAVYSADHGSSPIDVSALPSGIYYIRIFWMNGNSICKKVIISH
ncbi:MAG: T9SS type A sorting domain-containing protein [Bacteroidales bacterium]|nr:T9SS type A sorting domain-containing protein [Bacteroidales bacterium]